jgi:C1A family cysteine protease
MGTHDFHSSLSLLHQYRKGDKFPESTDWREKGDVTHVKDHGSCGICWDFSVVVVVEEINQIVTNQLISLSEQELVDYDTSSKKVCNGGLMDNSFQFIVNNGGIDNEVDYPYRAQDGVCDTNRKISYVVTIDGYEYVTTNDEKLLKKDVKHQPISVSIQDGLRRFTSGCNETLTVCLENVESQ